MPLPKPTPTQKRNALYRKIFQLAMGAVVASKLFWLFLGISFVGFHWQIDLFAAVVLILIVSIIAFAKENRLLGLILAWVGFFLALGTGLFGGAPSGPTTDRIHDQFRFFGGDFVFLLVAHLQFWLLGKIAADNSPSANGG